MKVQCEGCGELMEPEVRPAASGIELVCTRCGHVGLLGGGPQAVAPAAPAARELVPVAPEEVPAQAPVAVLESVAARRRAQAAARRPAPNLKVEVGKGDVRCPKCGYRQDDPVACHRCGLALVGRGGEGWDDVPPGLEAAAKELDARWEQLVAGEFEDVASHKAFIHFARTSGLLDRASRHYRFFAQDHAGQPAGDVAAGAIEQIVEMMHAEFVMSAGAGEQAFARRVKRIKQGLMVFAVIMCVGVLILAFYLFVPSR